MAAKLTNIFSNLRFTQSFQTYLSDRRVTDVAVL